ncbi:DUF4124 domain-containing protein [Inhella proteolytica]|uniref:DUF4124 domain-containing protein n=1 Tax=Inhella proteolytica TaxID=2795029 RepID=A0A931IZZ9_9BURK|nr:DUF4124 domain-containing protein [Inhella proteolytica]MBH9576939.1 DUF4124 domain-containing protein [Inhella proteolytica]
MRHPTLLALLLLASACAQAQYQCRQPDGATRFQQTPCASGEAETALKLPARSAAPPPGTEARRAQLDELDRRVAVRKAIEAGQPLVSMSLAELDLALGRAEEVQSGQQVGGHYEHRFYSRNGRQYAVTTQNGVVTAVQERALPPTERAKPCASAREIRDLEIEISKIANRDNARLQADLQRRLAEARACR